MQKNWDLIDCYFILKFALSINMLELWLLHPSMPKSDGYVLEKYRKMMGWQLTDCCGRLVPGHAYNLQTVKFRPVSVIHLISL